MKHSYWLFGLILIIAGTLRLANIKNAPPGLYPDEAMNGNNALEALETGEFKVFYPENNGREGLFINILAGSVALFGNEPWALRIPSAIFGILTVIGIYFLARELFKNERVALLAAFLTATSFWHIVFSRIAFRAIMAPFFLVWATYFALLALRKSKNTPAARYLTIAAVGGLFLGAGLHSYIAYRIMPLIFLALIPFHWKEKKFYAVAAVFALFALVAFLPLGIYFLNNPQDFFGRTTQISVFDADSPLKEIALNTIKTIGMFFVAGDYNWRHNFAGRPELYWPVSVLFAIGAAYTLITLFRKQSWKPGGQAEPLLLLSLWFGFAMAPVVISNEGIPHALRAILMIPPVFIFAAVGGVKLYHFLSEQIKSRALLKFGAFLLFTLLTFEAYHTYFIKWATNSETKGAFTEKYVAIGKEINDLPRETPKIVVVKAGGVDVRGIPMPAQTTMFITGSFTERGRKAKNISYVSPQQFESLSIPPYAVVFTID